jgi:proton-translocating NADH-quinone oxidoreductase chain L
MFGRFFGRGNIIILLCGIGLSFLFSVLKLIQYINRKKIIFIILNSWIMTDSIYVTWSFMFDSLSCSLLALITLISLSIHLYSVDYMFFDLNKYKFFVFLSLFTFFMLILISSDNFLQLFLGWEGVGVCSFLLINFWHTRIQANKSAIKAMIYNRIGDFSFFLGLCALFYQCNSLNYSVLFALTPYISTQTLLIGAWSCNILTLITFCLFGGAIGKSAQIGLHAWLPDAMEGPTPVSALLHSATMVTAGVFLLIRMSLFFEYASHLTLFVITLFGALTTLFAATIGLVQYDLKKIIAYSTCSQLGYMIFACGLSQYTLSLFHLINHAFFKALLFLCSGIIIHALSEEQDIRKMGGLYSRLPFTYSIMLIASFSLLGFPFLSGFYSKDLILEAAYSQYTTISHFAYWLGCIAAFCTAFYSIRLLFLVFFSTYNGFRPLLNKSTDISLLTCLSFLCLVFPSIFSGFYFKELFTGIGVMFWKKSLYLATTSVYMEHDFLPVSVKLYPIFFSCLGILAGVSRYFNYFFVHLYFINSFFRKFLYFQVFNFLNRKWYFDKISHLFYSQNVLQLSYNKTYQRIDRGFLDFFGPAGITFFIAHLATIFSQIQVNSIYIYLYFFISLFTLFLLSISCLTFCISFFLVSLSFLISYNLNLFIKETK